MLQYPSIGKNIIDVPVYAFDKIDGQSQHDSRSDIATQKKAHSMAICEMCPNEIGQRKSKLPTCSRECSIRRNRRLNYVTVSCSHCRVTFERHRNRVAEKIKAGHEHYCSRKCMAAYQRLQHLANGARIEVPCGFCGATLIRQASTTKNFKNSYCSIEHRSLAKAKSFEDRTCAACGDTFSTRKTSKTKACSATHGNWLRTPGLIPLRLAWERDETTFVDVVKANCSIAESECWQPRWTDVDYPPMSVPKYKATQLHRIMLMVTDRTPRDSVEQAHHTCANKRCVNPDHLQWLSPGDNLAEMKERGRYVLRIKRLEEALREAAPNHPLLPRIYEEEK